MISQIMSHTDLKIFMHASLVLFITVYILAMYLVFHPKRKNVYTDLAKKVIQDDEQPN